MNAAGLVNQLCPMLPLTCDAGALVQLKALKAQELQELRRIEELKSCLSTHEARCAELEQRLDSAEISELSAISCQKRHLQEVASTCWEQERQQLQSRLEELKRALFERQAHCNTASQASQVNQVNQEILQPIRELSILEPEPSESRTAQQIAALRVSIYRQEQDLRKDLQVLATEVAEEAAGISCEVRQDLLDALEAAKEQAKQAHEAEAQLRRKQTEAGQGAFSCFSVKPLDSSAKQQAFDEETRSDDLCQITADALDSAARTHSELLEEQHLEFRCQQQFQSCRAQNIAEQNARLRHALAALKKDHEEHEEEKAMLFDVDLAAATFEADDTEECYTRLRQNVKLCEQEEERHSELLAEEASLCRELRTAMQSKDATT
eukprot:s3350_g3.t1